MRPLVDAFQRDLDYCNPGKLDSFPFYSLATRKGFIRVTDP